MDAQVAEIRSMFSRPPICDAEIEEFVARTQAVRDALEMFLLQWNAFGPNSAPGDAFKHVRNAAVKALGTDAPKYRADLPWNG